MTATVFGILNKKYNVCKYIYVNNRKLQCSNNYPECWLLSCEDVHSPAEVDFARVFEVPERNESLSDTDDAEQASIMEDGWGETAVLWSQLQVNDIIDYTH